MNRLDSQYQDLLRTILSTGDKKGDRTGTGTISIFGKVIRHRMSEGFPILTTKKVHFKSIISELIWFLQGRTDLRFLLENKNHIWTGDAYKKYLKWNRDLEKKVNESDETKYAFFKGQKIMDLSKSQFEEKILNHTDFSEVHGDLGPIYGAQWRNWKSSYNKNEKGIDQFANLIHDLKTNPDSRRLIINSWNISQIDSMTLPPCHYSIQFWTRELNMEERRKLWNKKTKPIEKSIEGLSVKDANDIFDQDEIPKREISLIWNQRSVDTPLGLPFNIASYGLLLEIVGKMVNMVPDELIGFLGDTHIYNNQIEGCKTQIYRTSFPLPTLKHKLPDQFYKYLSENLSELSQLKVDDFVLENYVSHPSIDFPLSN